MRQICEKLFPFELQASNLVLLKIRALVVDVEPRANLNVRNVCTKYMRKCMCKRVIVVTLSVDLSLSTGFQNG